MKKEKKPVERLSEEQEALLSSFPIEPRFCCAKRTLKKAYKCM